jgi:hypothetical protein
MERLADRYELGDALGQGRSTVYRAVDERLRRDVAIKRVELLAGQEDAEQVRTRALREAQASARLNNPSVVTVFDVVEEAGAIWLVMELVDGPSLSQVVADDGPLTHERAAAIGLGVLTALEAAHLVGVVHRDVKPANVLVREGDRAKLTDFGVATIRDESRVTATGLIVGSPSYMAPEQATGGDITPATDLWALGALLYFAVEGEPPFQAGNALATASAVVYGEPRAQARPGPLSPVVARLLTKDPAARARAGEVRATLSRVARGERRRAPVTPPATPPATPPDPAPVVTPATPQVAEPVASPAPAPDSGVTPLSAAVDAAPAPATPRRRPRPALVVAGAGLLLAAVVAVPALVGDDGDPTGEPDSGAEAGAQAGAATTDTTAPGTTAPETTTTAASALPAGWTPFQDPEGAYEIGLPPGWQVQPTDSPTRIDLVDPASGSLLRVEWVSPPNGDPVGAWQAAVPAFASNNSNYQEIGIGPATYRDYDAALWEFRHGSDPTMHTGNLGFVTNGRGYALMLRTPEDQWAASQPLFEQFKQAFQPT